MVSKLVRHPNVSSRGGGQLIYPVMKRIITAAAGLIVFCLMPRISYGELLNASTYEFRGSGAFSTKVPSGSAIKLTVSPEAEGTLRCVSGYDGSLYFEAAANQTITTTRQIYNGNSMTCSGEVTPHGVGLYRWTVVYNGGTIMTLASNIMHADCSAEVQNINLGVLSPGGARSVPLPVVATGGHLRLTSTDMSGGIIKLGGSEDVAIQPGDNITAGNDMWTNITDSSTINVITSDNANGIYTSIGAVTLRCN